MLKMKEAKPPLSAQSQPTRLLSEMPAEAAPASGVGFLGEPPGGSVRRGKRRGCRGRGSLTLKAAIFFLKKSRWWDAGDKRPLGLGCSTCISHADSDEGLVGTGSLDLPSPKCLLPGHDAALHRLLRPRPAPRQLLLARKGSKHSKMATLASCANESRYLFLLFNL